MKAISNQPLTGITRITDSGDQDVDIVDRDVGIIFGMVDIQQPETFHLMISGEET
jgi:hypothetical protein